MEAGTWAGLLIGMYLKYITQTAKVGVQIFGELHGYAFLAYVAITIVAAIRLRWPWYALVVALLAAIPPMMTIPLRSGYAAPAASSKRSSTATTRRMALPS
ncbi:DUF3817 domain-containing protein [Microbacterium sp. ZW T5_45]|uniref:DUF3817 domain-containing protein n=1 Tax=Microbacterium sp. ZW T5_45 TaxID=3378080 RepID=UPI00385349CA